MRTHGWGGSTPSTDEAAIERILDAADQIIDAEDGEFHVAKVARALGISRQTVYNYFPGTGALLEAVAYTMDSLAEEKGARLLFSYDLTRASKRITSKDSIRFNRDMLRRFDVDWSAVGLGDQELEDISEYMLRIVELFMIDPTDVSTGKALRAYLSRWVAPVFRAEVESHRHKGKATTEQTSSRSRRRSTALGKTVARSKSAR